MTVRARLGIGIVGALVSCAVIAAVADAWQRRQFESMQKNIDSPRRSETKASVIAKLGQPDVMRTVSPEQLKYGYVDCREYFYYRPNFRILDEEYSVCFDERGQARHAEYLVSQ